MDRFEPKSPKTNLLDLLGKHGKRPLKQLGQHYFIDEPKADRILDFFDFPKNVPVLEVGPGTGFWTQKLLARGYQVAGVELERRSIEVLKERLGHRGLLLLHADIRQVNLNSILKQLDCDALSVFGAIPYHATSPILRRVFEWSKTLVQAGIILQSEAAKRLTASVHSKRYGVLSVLLQATFEMGLGSTIGRGSFHPEPKVNSVPLRMKPRTYGACASPDTLKVLVRSAFNQRRKGFLKALQTSPLFVARSGLLEALRQQCPFELGGVRAENISPSQYLQLAAELDKTLSKGAQRK